MKRSVSNFGILQHFLDAKGQNREIIRKFICSVTLFVLKFECKQNNYIWLNSLLATSNLLLVLLRFLNDKVYAPPVCLWWVFPSRHLLGQSNNESIRTTCEICSNIFIHMFHTLFCCFHCWLWTSKCRQGSWVSGNYWQIIWQIICKYLGKIMETFVLRTLSNIYDGVFLSK